MSHNSIKQFTGIEEGVTTATGLSSVLCAKQEPNCG